MSEAVRSLSARLAEPGSAHPPAHTGGAMAVAASARFEVDPALRSAWEKAVTRYPKRRAAVMELLHSVQDRFGFVPREAVAAIAGFLEIPDVWVFEVLTFYPMYRATQGGRHAVRVCHNIACDLMGARGLLRALRERFGVRPGETAGEGAFHLETVECLAACGGAPVVDVDGEYHEGMTPGRLCETVGKLLDGEPR
ncbi:MAG TPA: NADH-quinone oxidoreductase subunit NuoE [Planctomycetota bacterium]|nr:NADH-quinone oxidoreductase subunit NuoE [Planctomycetota bacterium]